MQVSTQCFEGAIADDKYWQTLANKTVLVITSPTFVKNGKVRQLVDVLPSQAYVFDRVKPNPDIADIRLITQQYAAKHIDCVIALGGGSVLDTAKVMSRALMLNSEALSIDELNTSETQLVVVGIPTTAGTGSEVTPFATVWDHQAQKKYSVGNVICHHVVLDPSLLVSLNREQRLYPALDALSHALESLWNRNKTTQSSEYATNAIALICDALPTALEDKADLCALAKLQRAAFLAGSAIAITKTAIAHAISYPLTLKYDVPHGLACSFSLLAILNENSTSEHSELLKIKGVVANLLKSIDFIEELAPYVSAKKLLDEFDYALEPSRAGNYIGSISKDAVSALLKASMGVHS